jgi:chromosome segregation ATPase
VQSIGVETSRRKTQESILVEEENMSRDKSDQVSQATAAAIDINRIEALGSEVMSAVKTLRELLDARASALEACRSALEEHYTKLSEDRSEFDKQQNELCDELEVREREVVDREARCRELQETLDEMTQGHEADVAAFREQEEQLTARLQDVQVREEGLAGRESDITRQEEQFAEKQQQIKQQLSSLEAGRQKLTEASARFEEERAEWEASHAEIAKSQETLNREQAQLEKTRSDVMAQRDELVLERQAIETRESELSKLAKSLDQQRLEIEEQQKQVTLFEQEWRARMNELSGVRSSLNDLQNELTLELGNMTEQKETLLPKYGASKGGEGNAAADGGLPQVSEQQREAVERFQKLCRDAKRRAIGSDQM